MKKERVERDIAWSFALTLEDGPTVMGAGCASETQARIVAEGIKKVFPVRRATLIKRTYNPTLYMWEKKESKL